MFKNKNLVFSIFLLLVVLPAWYFVVVPRIEKIPLDFYYQADIFSLDNFYDEETQMFLGEQISKTKFSYEVVSFKQGVLEIKNIFDVRKMTGEKIFAVKRIYGIDALTGQHVRGHGDRDRDGYLFAPEHLKKEDYVYWHINYDSPALLKFQEEETIHGLKVYRYAANYHADQTKDLGFLPGVPEKRGVNLDIDLQVWVEPVSGWLVKYEDRTVAYYYDIQTGERIHPWNKFSNKYADKSVILQVKNAQARKLTFIFFKIIIPLILGIITIILTYSFLFKSRDPETWQGEGKDTLSLKEQRPYYLLFFFLILFLIGFLFFYYVGNTTTRDQVPRVGISDWVPGTLLEENIRGFKDALREAGYQEGTNIEYIYKTPQGDKNRQSEIIRSFIQEKVDLIYTLTTPGTVIAKSVTSQVPIVFSVVTYPVESNIIQSLDSSGNNLVGTRNYIPPFRQYYFFERIYPHTKTLGFVHRKGEPNSAIQYEEFKDLLSKRNISVVDIAAVNLEDMRRKISEHIDQVDSLYAACDTLIQAGGEAIVIEFSQRFRKPSFSCNQDGAIKGALIGNIADLYTIGKVAGTKAAEILKGAQPRWLQTATPTVDHIIVNRKTARDLGLEIPQDVLLKAVEIIDE